VVPARIELECASHIIWGRRFAAGGPVYNRDTIGLAHSRKINSTCRFFLGLPFCGCCFGSPVHDRAIIGLMVAQSQLAGEVFTCASPNPFGAAVLRSGSPIYDCDTIGLAHSRNSQGKALSRYAFPEISSCPLGYRA